MTAVLRDRAGPPAPVTVRAPTPGDASALWRLVGETGGLDRNSPYAYLLVCSHFAATSAVADAGDGAAGPARLGGFLSGYRPPGRPEALFVWQVAVAPGLRGRGLGRRMLEEVLARPALAGLTHVEATVGPANAASQALFRSFARRRSAPVAVTDAFGADLFPEPGHEPELLFRIGPLGPPPPQDP